MAENVFLAYDDPTIISLFQALDDFQKEEQAKAIEKLERERKTLQREIKHCRKVWFATIALLRTGFNNVLTIQTALEEFSEQERLASQGRLKFWEISAQYQFRE
ncbi:hypothetical protein K432DRAFT_195358 [Lepidopterella palustris CBS 459.81]|uniref:Uncharacterized protein n=1 Tax=Lepidopterella palustris CBS 459.81 TaxID=1314670 RepID=A0A8E2J9S3_9PEZI|nr:hypothetical protein K432DRAFT_195358 [Lepidopterella palustris CBS 459.81]